MAESPAHRPDLLVSRKYRLGKKIGSGSCGMCYRCLTMFVLAHPPHLPALQLWQKVPLTDLISSPAASIGSERRSAQVLVVCAVAVSQMFALAHPPHLPALQPRQKVPLTDPISSPAASIGLERRSAWVLAVCAVPVSQMFVLARSPTSPSCTTTMAESPAHRPNFRVGGKYRHGKNISSGSFGMCCRYLMTFALAHPPHLPALQPRQKVPLTDPISMLAGFLRYVRCCLTNVCARSPPSPSCTTTMAESPAHRLDLRVCSKYRFSKMIASISFGLCCSKLTPSALLHPPHLPALQPWQKVPLTDSISASAASIGSAR